MPFWVKSIVEAGVRRWAMADTAPTAFVALVATMRFAIFDYLIDY